MFYLLYTWKFGGDGINQRLYLSGGLNKIEHTDY